MAVTFEEAKAFIADAIKARDSWLTVADRSWDEIKKRQRNGRIWSVTPNSSRRRARYPAWYSIFKIRGPLLLSRIGIPIGKDTTQDGNDNVGATAAICLERLAVNLARSFDFFDVMAAARDDFLATNVGEVRGFYERDTVKEPVKEYITPQKRMDNMGNEEVIFIGSDGEEVMSDEIMQDDTGYFIEHEQTIDVENERICLEPVLYREFYVDPAIRRWARCKRVAFANYYSRDEFRDIFGDKALMGISFPEDDKPGEYENKSKQQMIKVFEYWDLYERKCYWFAEYGEGFIEPKGEYQPEEFEEDEQPNGLYNLEKFFPCPKPLLMNAPTDEFWPVPEFYQVVEITEDIHTIFSRMMALTRAIRVRLLFDNNVESLQALINEASEGDAIGVPNLAQSLMSAGGNLANVVQYLPIAEMIEGLNQTYTALEQRLMALFKLTGTSDLLQGLTTTNTDKTLGERQMEEKYAINQIAEAQRKMQEFVRDSYQLICEMALKNFKDSSLDQYIIPQTLQPEHQERYRAAIGLLRDDTKRFRIELETDSTIALNEQYDKAMRVELVNTLTQAIERTANTAQTSPALVGIELHALKYLIQGMRQGKMFQNEITQAIDQAIKAAQSAPPAFNKDEEAVKVKEQELQIKAQEVQATMQLQQYKVQSDERIQVMKLQQDGQIAALGNQIKQFELSLEQGKSVADLELSYAQLTAEVNKAQQELQLKHDALLVEIRKITDKKEADQFAAMIDMQLQPYQQQLEGYRLQLDQAELQLRAQEQALKEQQQSFQAMNTQIDNQRQEMRMQLDAVALKHEMTKPPEIPPITINMPQPATTKKKVKISRDELGNMTELIQSDEQSAE
jgi:hypothetical protein